MRARRRCRFTSEPSNLYGPCALGVNEVQPASQIRTRQEGVSSCFRRHNRFSVHSSVCMCYYTTGRYLVSHCSSRGLASVAKFSTIAHPCYNAKEIVHIISIAQEKMWQIHSVFQSWIALVGVNLVVMYSSLLPANHHTLARRQVVEFLLCRTLRLLEESMHPTYIITFLLQLKYAVIGLVLFKNEDQHCKQWQRKNATQIIKWRSGTRKIVAR